MTSDDEAIEDAVRRMAKKVAEQMERVERDELSLRHAAAEVGMIPSEFTAVYAAARSRFPTVV